jgi:hypothetical protein
VVVGIGSVVEMQAVDIVAVVAVAVVAVVVAAGTDFAVGVAGNPAVVVLAVGSVASYQCQRTVYYCETF